MPEPRGVRAQVVVHLGRDRVQRMVDGGGRSENAVKALLVLVCMPGQMPLCPADVYHCPPRSSLASKTLGFEAGLQRVPCGDQTAGPGPDDGDSRTIGETHDATLTHPLRRVCFVGEDFLGLLLRSPDTSAVADHTTKRSSSNASSRA